MKQIILVIIPSLFFLSACSHKDSRIQPFAPTTNWALHAVHNAQPVAPLPRLQENGSQLQECVKKNGKPCSNPKGKKAKANHRPYTTLPIIPMTPKREVDGKVQDKAENPRKAVKCAAKSNKKCK